MSNICPYCNEWHNENIACSYMSAGVNRVKNDLTKRELFAAMAMQGIISNADILKTSKCRYESDIAKLAIEVADALLEALEQEK